jgi:hypothetical protein
LSAFLSRYFYAAGLQFHFYLGAHEHIAAAVIRKPSQYVQMQDLAGKNLTANRGRPNMGSWITRCDYFHGDANMSGHTPNDLTNAPVLVIAGAGGHAEDIKEAHKNLRKSQVPGFSPAPGQRAPLPDPNLTTWKYHNGDYAVACGTAARSFSAFTVTGVGPNSKLTFRTYEAVESTAKEDDGMWVTLERTGSVSLFGGGGSGTSTPNSSRHSVNSVQSNQSNGSQQSGASNNNNNNNGGLPFGDGNYGDLSGALGVMSGTGSPAGSLRGAPPNSPYSSPAGSQRSSIGSNNGDDGLPFGTGYADFDAPPVPGGDIEHVRQTFVVSEIQQIITILYDDGRGVLEHATRIELAYLIYALDVQFAIKLEVAERYVFMRASIQTDGPNDVITGFVYARPTAVHMIDLFDGLEDADDESVDLLARRMRTDMMTLVQAAQPLKKGLITTSLPKAPAGAGTLSKSGSSSSLSSLASSESGENNNNNADGRKKLMANSHCDMLELLLAKIWSPTVKEGESRKKYIAYKISRAEINLWKQRVQTERGGTGVLASILVAFLRNKEAEKYAMGLFEYFNKPDRNLLKDGTPKNPPLAVPTVEAVTKGEAKVEILALIDAIAERCDVKL